LSRCIWPFQNQPPVCYASGEIELLLLLACADLVCSFLVRMLLLEYYLFFLVLNTAVIQKLLYCMLCESGIVEILLLHGQYCYTGLVMSFEKWHIQALGFSKHSYCHGANVSVLL